MGFVSLSFCSPSRQFHRQLRQAQGRKESPPSPPESVFVIIIVFTDLIGKQLCEDDADGGHGGGEADKGVTKDIILLLHF